ncbi:MAG: 30S ribosomal protein S11 [Candidatus Dojkabacteria bacterium]|nr:30S ribosomal protein S11 [Candidatus Dojkabacteria bacterium]
MGKQSIKKVEAAEEANQEKKPRAVSKGSSKKKKKSYPKAKVTLNCSYNNVVISFQDYSGNVFAWSSCGCVGFKGSRKGTAFAATKAAYDAYEKASRYGVQEASVVVKGVGMGRRSAVKGLRTAGLIITSLSDHSPVAHNGCRPRKKPRKR